MLKPFSSADIDGEEVKMTDQPENGSEYTNEKTGTINSPSYM